MQNVKFDQYDGAIAAENQRKPRPHRKKVAISFNINREAAALSDTVDHLAFVCA